MTEMNGEASLFFKRFLRNPARLGTLAPVSERLARLAASCVSLPSDGKIVEIGAGAGRLTRAFLGAGVKPKNLKAIELDPDLCAFAKENIKSVDFIEGNAKDLATLLPKSWIGSVDIVFSSIPFMYLPREMRAEITESVFDVLKPGGDFFHLTYNYWSPLEGMGYEQRRCATLWANFPPGFIWRYRKQMIPHLRAA